MKLRALRDKEGQPERVKGDVFDYMPWYYEWQSMTEEQRVAKELYIHCFGHGEFEVLRGGEDVERIDI